MPPGKAMHSALHVSSIGPRNYVQDVLQIGGAGLPVKHFLHLTTRAKQKGAKGALWVFMGKLGSGLGRAAHEPSEQPGEKSAIG